MMLKFNTARAAAASPEDILRQAFADRIDEGGRLSAVFTDSQCIGAAGVAGLPLRLPAIQELLKLPEVAALLPKEAGTSALFTVNDTGTALSLHIRHAGRQEQTIAIPEAAASAALVQLRLRRAGRVPLTLKASMSLTCAPLFRVRTSRSICCWATVWSSLIRFRLHRRAW